MAQDDKKSGTPTIDFGSITTELIGEINQAAKKAVRKVIDPDGNGKLDIEHAQAFAKLIPTDIEALKKAIHTNNPGALGQQLIPSSSTEILGAVKSLIENKEERGGLGIEIKLPKDSEEVLIKAAKPVIDTFIKTNNQRFFDNDGNGVVVPPEMKAAMDKAHQQGVAITPEQLKDYLGTVIASPDVIKEGMAYQLKLKTNEIEKMQGIEKVLPPQKDFDPRDTAPKMRPPEIVPSTPLKPKKIEDNSKDGIIRA